MRIAFVWVLVAGCAGAPSVSHRFDASPEAVLVAAQESLREQGEVRVEDSAIETSWGPEQDEASEQGFLIGNPYRVRVRYRVELEGPTLRARATVERRAPGGPRSLRWQRVASDGRYEREFLEAVARRLNP